MESSEQIQTYFWFIRFLIVLVCLGILWKIFDSVRNFFRKVRLRILISFRKANINRILRKLKRIRINQEFSDFDTKKSFIGRMANALLIDLPKSVSALLMSDPLSYVFWFFWILLGSNLFGNLWEPGLAPLGELLAVCIVGFLVGAFLSGFGGGGDVGDAAIGLVGIVCLIYYIYELFLYWYVAYLQTYNTEDMIILVSLWAVFIEASIRIGYHRQYDSLFPTRVLGMETAGDEIFLINKPIKIIHVVFMILCSLVIYIWGKWVILITGVFDFFSILARPTQVPLIEVKMKDIENYFSWKNKEIGWNEFVSISGGLQRTSDIKNAMESEGD